MKFMIEWNIPTGIYKAAGERFFRTPAPDPGGLKTAGCWHAPGSARGWHCIEGSTSGMAELAATWCDTVKLQITYVIEDEEAAGGLARVDG